MAGKKIDRERLALFVVCEGEAYSLNDAPGWLNQSNWLCDWTFIGAYSPEEAIAVALTIAS